MKIKIIFSLFIFVLSAWNVRAEPVNFNWVDTTVPSYTHLIHGEVKHLTSGCIKISCYEDINSILGQEVYSGIEIYHKNASKVQPLTMSTVTIGKVFDGLMANSLTPYQSYNYLTGTIGTTALHQTSNQLSCGSEQNYAKTVYEGRGVPFGGHSSAMEGLLWSWRMVSNSWQGVWATESAHETTKTDALVRKTLPNPANGKHIILVSDGIDNDGPDHLPPGQRMVITNPKDQAFSTYTDDNGQKILPILNYSKAFMPIGVCDAHKPFRSIKAQDYTNVCNKLKEQNIKVHVLFTGYTGDNNANLLNCANITGGKYFNLSVSSKAEIIAALDEVFSVVKVSTPSQIKLEAVPEGF